MSSILPAALILVGPLRNRNFRIYTSGSAVSLVGTWTQRIAAGWLTWELTQSGAWLGIVAFADLFPTVIVSLVAGAAADRWDRLRVTKITQALALLQSLVLFVLTATGYIGIEVLLGLTLFLGVVDAFNQPARLALLPSLVPASDLRSAVAINSIIFNLARFVGPAIAGLTILAFGVSAAFAVNAATFVVFLAALARVRPTQSRLPTGARVSFGADLVGGLRYMANHAGVSAMLVLMVATSVGGRPVVELLPAFAAEVFNSGIAGFATFTSSIGIGAIIAGLWLGGRGNGSGLTRIVLATSLLLALANILLIATEWGWVAVPALAVIGFCMSATGIGFQTLIHLSVDDAMRGRVLSAYGLIFRGGPAIGALTMGILSEQVGLRLPVVVGATIVIAAWLWAHMRYDRVATALENQISRGGRDL